MPAARKISRTVQNPYGIAGILLFSSFLFLLLALIILIASGALPAFSAGLQGSLAEKATYADIFRLLNLFWTVGWIVQLLGFATLTRLQLHAGDESLALLAITAIFVASILGILHGTFHMSVESWAAQEAARTGSVPQAYEPLQAWISSAFRIAYVLHLLGTTGLGWSLLETGVLPTWVGWAAIGWSVLWLVGYLAGAGAPGLLFIMPAVIGAALVMKMGELSV